MKPENRIRILEHNNPQTLEKQYQQFINTQNIQATDIQPHPPNQNNPNHTIYITYHTLKP